MFKLHVGKNVGKGLATGLVACGCLLAFSSAAFAQSAKPADVVVTVVGDEAQMASEPGVLIVAVEPESPAAKAGLKRGDVLLQVGDQAVNALPELRTALAAMAAGDEVSLTVQHGDATNTLKLTLGERNGQAFLGIQPYVAMGTEAGMVPGLQIQRGAPAAPLEALPAMPAQPGIQVLKVEEKSPAAAAGLQAGDLIVALNGTELVADGTVRKLLRSLKPGDKVTLTIQATAAGAGAESSEVTVTLGENPTQPGVGYFGMQIAPTVRILRGQVPGGEEGQGFMPGHPDNSHGKLPGNMQRRLQARCAQMEERRGQQGERQHRPGRFLRWLCRHANMGSAPSQPGAFFAPNEQAGQEQFFFSAPVDAPFAPAEDVLFFYNQGVTVDGTLFELPVPSQDVIIQALPPGVVEQQIQVITETL